MQSKRQSAKADEKRGGASRREFLAATAGLGAAGLAFAASQGSPVRGSSYQRTLFFNFSHANHVGSTYYLMVAGKRYLLQQAASHPALLQATQRSQFLRSLPSNAITHVVEGVSVPSNNVVLTYVMNNVDTSTGEYQISSLHLLIPNTGYQHAFQQAKANLGAGEPLPLSAKRKKYGLPPAASLQDLMEEQELLDTIDFASTLVNFHTELLSADPSSAAHIQTNHISSASILLSQALEDPSIGPAMPQQTPGQDNASGWATLVPYTDDDGKPMIGQSGTNKGLILYDTQWQPDTIGPLVSNAIAVSLQSAKNDTLLGVDVTAGRTNIPTSDLTGKIWCRRDGTTSVEQGPETALAAIASTSASYTLKNTTFNQNGYTVSTPATSESGAVTLNFENSYLRWLALYAQFLDKDGNPIPTSKVPGISRATPLDSASLSYLGILTPEFTIYGIPVLPSKFSVSFEFPAVANSANILASGLGYGNSTYPYPEVVGAWLTNVFNLGLPAFMITIGVATELPPIVKTFIIPFVTSSVATLLSLIIGSAGQSDGVAWKSFVRALLNPTGPLKPFLTQLGELLAAAEITSELEDAIPLVGAILQATAALGALAEITETSCEVVLSPKTYQYTLIGQHDLTVKIQPETNQQFPLAAAYCQLTATFDRGAPFVARPNAKAGSSDPITYTFTGVPLGGNVTASVAIYSADGTLVGHGSSASVANDLNAAPSITFTQDRIPITNATQYQHQKKTSLDAGGNHVWVCAPAPGGTADSLVCENSPGTLCGLRNITVSSNNIGYGWQSYTQAQCQSGAAGSLDQLANIPNSNASNGNAQGGYALTPCALNPGAKIVYDPSAGTASNFYVDSATKLLRKVSLNPPGFPGGKTNAWGVFNTPSSDLLLHPGGTVVSINSQISKIETVSLPSAGVSDSKAASLLLADVHCGQGKRAGLLDTPIVATINAQGTLIVLEAGNNRLHALDIAGNPVPLFTKQPEAYFFNFSQTGGQNTQYLDCAVEFSGLIYVLSRTFGNSSVYRLDIYAQDQQGTNPISTTMGFNVAKLTVDYWRNVYTLNYEVLKKPDGSLPSVTEPSVSVWLPTTPPPCGEATAARQMPQSSPYARATVPGRPLRRRDLWRPWGSEQKA